MLRHCSRGDAQVERTSCFVRFEYIKWVFQLHVCTMIMCLTKLCTIIMCLIELCTMIMCLTKLCTVIMCLTMLCTIIMCLTKLCTVIMCLIKLCTMIMCLTKLCTVIMCLTKLCTIIMCLTKLCTVIMCLINAQSVRNKVPQLIEYIIEHGLDIVAITETWLHNTSEGYVSCCEFLHSPFRVVLCKLWYRGVR